MLVLTRKSGQKLIINDNIEILIVESNNGSVKIGINAPKEVSIYREEIWREIKGLNKVAPKITLKDVDKLSSLVKDCSTTTSNTKLNNLINKVNKHE